LVQPTPDVVLEGISQECCVDLTFSPDPRFILVRDEHLDDEFGSRRVLRI